MQTFFQVWKVFKKRLVVLHHCPFQLFRVGLSHFFSVTEAENFKLFFIYYFGAKSKKKISATSSNSPSQMATHAKLKDGEAANPLSSRKNSSAAEDRPNFAIIHQTSKTIAEMAHARAGRGDKDDEKNSAINMV